ncbi:hypothetical protein GGR57DRAFT_512489 [Xylariaceae sp. FL1272]|nr:hypothetical protein GGR57DRAFT_512489 [Xylariaceae sp. FL1272]
MATADVPSNEPESTSKSAALDSPSTFESKFGSSASQAVKKWYLRFHGDYPGTSSLSVRQIEYQAFLYCDRAEENRQNYLQDISQRNGSSTQSDKLQSVLETLDDRLLNGGYDEACHALRPKYSEACERHTNEQEEAQKNRDEIINTYMPNSAKRLPKDPHEFVLSEYLSIVPCITQGTFARKTRQLARLISGTFSGCLDSPLSRIPRRKRSSVDTCGKCFRKQRDVR